MNEQVIREALELILNGELSLEDTAPEVTKAERMKDDVDYGFYWRVFQPRKSLCGNL